MNLLDLAWKSFEFYSNKISDIEPIYQAYHFVLDSYLDDAINLEIKEKQDLKTNFSQTIASLYNLYQKQIQALDDIIENTPSLDVPVEFESDPASISMLKDLTFDLIIQLEKDQDNIKKYLN